MNRSVCAVLAGFLYCSMNISGANAPSPPLRQDSSWKKYVNKDLGYCVSYPSRWRRGEAFDGAGMFFETGVKRFSKPLGEIDIGALPSPEDLGEIVRVHLEGLKKFERAEDMEVLERREMRLLDSPALFTKDRYFDPQDRDHWVDEILLAKHGGQLYRLELECRAEQLARFEPVFSRFVQSFKFDCNSKR